AIMRTNACRFWNHRAMVFASLLLCTVHGATAMDNFCRATSRAAFRAGLLEAQSDFSIALGKCDNVSDPAQRKMCRAQALADYRDALSTTRDQFAARQKVCDRLGGAPYDPLIAPSNFVDHINNPFFPLTPGTKYYYLGQTAQGVE